MSRYQLPSAVLIVLMASNLLRGIRLQTRDLAVAGVLSLIAISGGIQLMSEKAEERWEPASACARATLSGIDAAAPDVQPGYAFKLGASFDLTAAEYLSAVEAHGSPAFTPTELQDQEPPFRTTADSSLISSSGIALSGTPAVFTDPSCRKTTPAAGSLSRPPGTWTVENLGETELAVSLARLGAPPGILIGAVLPKSTAGMELPAGSLENPWAVSFGGEGQARADLLTRQTGVTGRR